jgi:hypothetical protein
METTMGKGYGEALALLEFGAKLGRDAKDERTKLPRTREPKEKKDDLDLLALLEKKRREYEAVKQFVNDQVKLNKPEEKKDDKDKKKESPFSERNIALFLLGITPPFWIIVISLLLHH